jgi:Zn-dependent protease
LNTYDLARTLEFLPGIVLGLTIHEFSHAWVAQYCGDTTARDEGRVTLNPLKHIDLLGFIMLLAVGFGWAKPVQFNEENLRNPKSDVMKIAIAGPLSNAVSSILLSILFAFSIGHVPVHDNATVRIIYEIILYAIYINWGLFVFNLIPLPPLDGSHLLLNQFRKFPAVYNALYKYGSFALFGIILISLIAKVNLLPIGPVIEYLTRGCLGIMGYHYNY